MTRVDILRFSIGGMVAQMITLDRPKLVRKLMLVGTALRDHEAGYDPPENLVAQGILH